MEQKDAFYLLFVMNFGKGPLFRNQIDLVNELISSPNSAYYTSKENIEQYNKTVSRLKAYISQLFSEDAKRNITYDFKNSLGKILGNKIDSNRHDVKEILELIVNDLHERNIGSRHLHLNAIKKNISLDSSLFERLFEAKYVTIFTTREINIELNVLNKKQAFVDILLEDLFNSLEQRKNIKRFRFNFPLLNTCILFWRGLEKAVYKYLIENKNYLSYILPLIDLNKSMESHLLSGKNESLNNITIKLLHYLSNNKIINVFHLTAPVYLTPSIAIDPNDPVSTNVFLFMPSEAGEDQIYKLPTQEVLFWKLFVWDNIKINNSGKEILYNNTFLK